MAKSYIREMEGITGRPIPTHQRLLLKEDMQNRLFLELSAEGKLQHRDLFRSRKNALIKLWEKQTKQTWPVYTIEKKLKSGELKKEIRNYDAHEIIPNEFGGPLQWHNLHPAKGGGEHQGGIHGTGSSLNAILKQFK